jgi:hypothetical protein
LRSLFGRDVRFHLLPRRLQRRPELRDLDSIDLIGMLLHGANRKTVTVNCGAFALMQLFQVAYTSLD